MKFKKNKPLNTNIDIKRKSMWKCKNRTKIERTKIYGNYLENGKILDVFVMWQDKTSCQGR